MDGGAGVETLSVPSEFKNEMWSGRRSPIDNTPNPVEEFDLCKTDLLERGNFYPVSYFDILKRHPLIKQLPHYDYPVSDGFIRIYTHPVSDLFKWDVVLTAQFRGYDYEAPQYMEDHTRIIGQAWASDHVLRTQGFPSRPNVRIEDGDFYDTRQYRLPIHMPEPRFKILTP